MNSPRSVVPKKRLDDFDLPPVGFIKIDVEGHEESVLHGAEGLSSGIARAS